MIPFAFAILALAFAVLVGALVYNDAKKDIDTSTLDGPQLFVRSGSLLLVLLFALAAVVSALLELLL